MTETFLLFALIIALDSGNIGEVNLRCLLLPPLESWGPLMLRGLSVDYMTCKRAKGWRYPSVSLVISSVFGASKC